VSTVRQFAWSSRILHWVMAAMLLAMLFIGVAMVGSLADYHVLVAIHRPLARVPENTLKFGVGLLLSAFGVFWIGEGLGFPWPGEDLSLFALLGGFVAVAALAVAVAKRVATSDDAVTPARVTS